MPTRLFIFTHGVGVSPASAFIPTLRAALEKQGHQTHAPAYPNSADPDFDDWKSTFETDLTKVWDGKTEIVLVGHSLGGYFTLRLLGESGDSAWTKLLKGVVLVAPTSMKRPERRKFYSKDVNWEHIRMLSPKFVLLYSEGDTYVARMHQDLIIEKVGDLPGFDFREPVGFNHFTMEDAPPVTAAVSIFV
jgi:predicted alpha/beta hydrolase family esterase